MFVRIYILSFVIHFSSSTINKDLVISSGLDYVSADAMALGFFIQVNNKGGDCEIECMPDRCCLQLDGEENCDVLEIMGGCSETVPGGATRTVRLAAPLLGPYDRRGFCVVYLDSRPEGRRVLRDTVTIAFDTTLTGDLPDIKPCGSVDHDPLNKCKPVDCDTYYNGQKPYFSPRLKRCVKAPSCFPTRTELPDVLYDATSNKCLRNNSISEDDLTYIKSLSSGNTRHTKDIIIIKNKTPGNDSTVHDPEVDSDNPNAVRTLISESVQDREKVANHAKSCIDLSGIGNRISNYLLTYKNTSILLVIMVAVLCALLYTMIYFLVRNCQCDKDTSLVSRFFNYRQDVSVTTPLIDTSNHDTETTYQCLSESSTNVDKKIKCYKACHKNKARSAKFSMSDDILAKCLTRRDWTRKPTRSAAIPELKLEELKQDRVKSSENKVNFENEVKKSKSAIKPKVHKSIVKRKTDSIDAEPSSEQELNSHMYTYENDIQKTSNHKKNKKTISLSSEKGAQACFSNDSVDDFLSERGMIFLAGENISKYTFSSDPTSNLHMKSSCSELLKTSNNNIVRNDLSSLRRKHHEPASDPGEGMKSPDNFNLELLHMSQASVFSSTNGSECNGVRGFKRTEDSRTSL